MENQKRHYKGKDVEMITAIAIIVEAAITHKAILQAKRSNWADPYFENLKTAIDNATQTYLGVDSAKDMRLATQLITGIQDEVLPILSEFKVQVEEDFKKDKVRRDEILRELGFTDFHKDVQRRDQEALVQLLYQFRQNMTPDLETEITSRGTSEDTITTIVDAADTIKNSNISQEAFKAGRKTITAAGVQAFNELYDEVITICKLATKFTRDQPDIQEKFSYTRTLKTLNNQSAEKEQPQPVTP